MSHFFCVRSVWPQPRNRLQEQEKALDPPSASRLPNTPQWLNNQWLPQTPVCHLISMLIASGLTIAGESLGEGSQAHDWHTAL